ncbi:hypothetical protein ACJVC5_03445 [Peredibacter sp. HCB2-198]|uniref:hypothetical protein n=1 Tax=Peredibacter sp. HCB2-198 TaxID=3383025 RepID=UPI0038B4AF8B
MRPRPLARALQKRPDSPEKLFTQVILAAKPEIQRLWEEGDRYFPKDGVQCNDEILHDKSVGRSYYQCQPHFWQCYWQHGVTKTPAIEIELFGQTFHVVAKASFEPISAYSNTNRYYKMFKRETPGLNLHYGYIVELAVLEIPGFTQPMVLTDSCRDTYLPERIYGYGKVEDRRDDGFIWDNFGREIYLDKFYVSNQQVNEWRILKGEASKIVQDRKLWPRPALLNLSEQKNYCAFFGKRLLEAKLFDAATMSPSDTKNPKPEKVLRPDTPWQRDYSRSFLGMAKINPDYQLTPLDCQLAQVQGCAERYFTTDSSTWMGFNFALGFYPESLANDIDPEKNLKRSSRFLAPSSEWHQLGMLSHWKGEQTENLPVAFRCYEEVVP